MWDIVDIIWPVCNDHFSKGGKEWVILDESLELSFPVRCDVYMVDGDVLEVSLELLGALSEREHLQPTSLCQVDT